MLAYWIKLYDWQPLHIAPLQCRLSNSYDSGGNLFVPHLVRGFGMWIYRRLWLHSQSKCRQLTRTKIHGSLKILIVCFFPLRIPFVPIVPILPSFALFSFNSFKNSESGANPFTLLHVAIIEAHWQLWSPKFPPAIPKNVSTFEVKGFPISQVFPDCSFSFPPFIAFLAKVTPIEWPTTSIFSAFVYLRTASINFRTWSTYSQEWVCWIACAGWAGPQVVP